MSGREDMGDLDIFATTLTEAAMPWVALLISIFVTIWLKETATNFAKGWSFLRNPAFSPGDNVYVDGEPATVISISLKETIFEIERDEKTIWRYVPNHRIEFIKLEKVIDKQ
jgi:hypothetical protein